MPLHYLVERFPILSHAGVSKLVQFFAHLVHTFVHFVKLYGKKMLVCCYRRNNRDVPECKNGMPTFGNLYAEPIPKSLPLHSIN